MWEQLRFCWMKSINYLLGYENLKIVQSSDMFRFSLDSILLPNFVTINKRTKKILDIGTGNAPIPLILSTRTQAKIIGIDIQKEAIEMAQQSVKLNHLESQIELVCEDIKDYSQKVETDTFDCITCNPPYFVYSEQSLVNDSKAKVYARHESTLELEDVMKVSRKLLKNNGVLALVHRPERLVMILQLMKKYNIEPKKIQFVYPKRDRDANILLIEGSKNGRPGLKILPPLYSHNEDGNYTDQIKKYFEAR